MNRFLCRVCHHMLKAAARCLLLPVLTFSHYGLADPLVLPAQPISLNSAGVLADEESTNCSISLNGSIVVYDSLATNLVSGAGTGIRHIYLRDRKTAITTLLSRAAGIAGALGNSDSARPVIAALSNLVAFESEASNLVTGDTNAFSDIFVRDTTSQAIARVSVSTTGVQANGNSYLPSISETGRIVCFVSNANNLVSGDTAGFPDVFIKDRQTQETRRVSRGLAASEANGDSSIGMPAISGDGRFVVFGSKASNIVNADTNGRSDVFVFDLSNNSTELVSIPPATDPFLASDSLMAMGHSSISRDGRFIVFGRDRDADGFAELLYLRDRQTSSTTLITKSPGGIPADLGSYRPTLSADGTRIGFYSGATNLLSSAPEGGVFMFYRDTGSLQLVHGGDGYAPCLSHDGSTVGFQQWNATSFFDELYLHELDDCPSDSNKLLPGACGCGIPDRDLNGNGVVDCKEALAPAAPLRIRLL